MADTGASAFPLAWPPYRERTHRGLRKDGLFRSTQQNRLGDKTRKPLTVTDARSRLATELERIGARAPVLSTNMELRADGQIRANQPEPGDPGAALYFQMDGRSIVLTCDKYTTVAANIAAICAHLEATRTIERHGVGTMSEMFRGFEALPAPDTAQGWRELLGNPNTIAQAEAAYRERAKRAHPDSGGSVELMARLNAARDAARRELRA